MVVMGVLQSFFATYSFGAVIGFLVGWAVFTGYASVSNCSGVMAIVGCPKMLLGMTFVQFTGAFAALGGFLVWGYQLLKGEFL
jgi:hypothetical protein